MLRVSPELYYEQSYTDVSDDMNTDLPESLTPMLKPLTAFEWTCVYSPLLPNEGQFLYEYEPAGEFSSDDRLGLVD